MSTRSRTRDSRKVVSGTLLRNGILSTYNALRGTLTVTDDTIGNWGIDNAFKTDRKIRLFGVIDGIKVPYGTPIFTHYPLLGVVGRAFPSTTQGLTTPNLAAMAPLWLGRMTPRAQAINLPAFLGELKDLPSMFTQIPDLIRSWGRRRRNVRTAAAAAGLLRDYSGDVGSAFLGWKFGWSPLMGDLAKMLGIMDAIMANIEMLSRLRAGRSIKRSLRLPPQIVTVDGGTTVLQSEGTMIRGRVTQVNSCKSWVTSRWEPLIPMMFHDLSDRQIFHDAAYRATGFTAGGMVDAWWELLPWSWLTDWFMNVAGQLARFTRNGWLLKCVSLCYMRTSQVHVYFALLPTENWVKVSGQNLLHRIVKERIPLANAQPSPTDPSPPALPVLSNSQMGILGALLAQKAKGVRL